MDRLKKGERLTLSELRELDRMKFKGYEKIIFEESDEATRYLMGVINELKQEEDKVREIMHDISVTNDYFDNAYKHFDDQVKRWMKESGISRLRFLKPGDLSMAAEKYSNDPADCERCLKKLYCPTHTIQRKIREIQEMRAKKK